MQIFIEQDKENYQFYSIIEDQKALLDYTVHPDGKTLDYTHTYTPHEL